MRRKLSAALRLAVYSAAGDLSAKWTGSTLTISDLAAAIDDVQLFVDVRDELLRKGLPFDTISAGSWAARVSAHRVIDFLVTEDAALAIVLCQEIISSLFKKSDPQLFERLTAQCMLQSTKATAMEREEALTHLLKFPKEKKHAVDIVRLLLQFGASLHAQKYHGETPLHVAAGRGDMALVTFLLVSGAALEAKMSDGERPIHLAKDAETTRLLVVAGAETSPLDGLGRTPLRCAVQYNRIAIATQLLDAGVDADERAGPQRRLRDRRLLHVAAQLGHNACAAALLHSRAEPDPRDEDGLTPLMLAARCGRKLAVRTLLQGGADPECTRARDGWRALHLAAQQGGYGVVNALVEGRADVTARDARGRTPLHVAVLHNRTRAARALLRAGAAADCIDGEGKVPADIAAERRFTRLLQVFEAHRQKLLAAATAGVPGD
ncbi:Ankyrin-2, partial [Cladochytrium tenue]